MLNLFPRPAQPPLQLRWLVASDLPTVVEIAAAGFDYPWLEKDFQEALRIQTVLGLVAEIGNQVVGYAIFEVHNRGITLLNLAVAGNAQGRGVGRALVNRLIQKLDAGCQLTAIVNERHLAAQLWLKSLGFRAKYVLREHFADRPDDPAEDGYFFHLEVANEGLRAAPVLAESTGSQS